MSMTIRPIAPKDVPTLLEMIFSLADHDGCGDLVTATEEGLLKAFFDDAPKVFAHVAEIDGEIVGYMIWYITFAGWFAKHGIWLLELFVQPRHRKTGIGRSLIDELKLICEQRNYCGVSWKSTRQNTSAHAFYRSIGARPGEDDIIFSLSAEH